MNKQVKVEDTDIKIVKLLGIKTMAMVVTF